MNQLARLAVLLSLPSIVGGCGRAIDAPSLAMRPVERQAVAAPDPAAEPEAAADPALASRIAAIVAGAEAGHARFERERGVHAAAIRRGAHAPQGSEPWLAAQVAASALATAAAPVRDAAAAIDALRLDPAHAGPADRAALDAASARVEALAADEQAALPVP